MDLIDKIFNSSCWEWEDCFIKHLSKNDDSGRHGVLIQKEFYSFFPELKITRENENFKNKIKFEWKINGAWTEKISNYIYYHKYPERRLSSLNPDKLNHQKNRIILIAKNSKSFRAEVFISGTKYFEEILKLHHHQSFEEGFSRKFSKKNYSDDLENEKNELIQKLKNISNQGWIKTHRSGSTGIGYTLETMLGIKANSSTEPDFKGIEIKSSRLESNVRISLFSKTPIYEPYSRLKLVETHGYEDNKGRLNINQTIHYNKSNLRGWGLKYFNENRLYTIKNNEKIFYWLRDILSEKLKSKHFRTMFVYAKNKGAGRNEEFKFIKAIYARDSNIENFDKELIDGNISIDLVMHKKENGLIRDHGFLFKITKNRMINLFSDITEYSLLNG